MHAYQRFGFVEKKWRTGSDPLGATVIVTHGVTILRCEVLLYAY